MQNVSRLSSDTCKCWHLCSSPASLRARFAVQNQPINQLHGSESHEEAVREIHFFFPKQQTLAVIKPDATEEHKGPFLFCIKKSLYTRARQTNRSVMYLVFFFHSLQQRRFWRRSVKEVSPWHKWRRWFCPGRWPRSFTRSTERSPSLTSWWNSWAGSCNPGRSFYKRVKGSAADWPQLPRAIQLLTALLTNVIILTAWNQDRRRIEAAKSISVSLFIPEHTQIDAQTELSSAPVNPLTWVVTQVLGHKGQSDGWDGAPQAKKPSLLPPHITYHHIYQ